MAAFDFIIVGQGIAGTTLAWALRWAGRRVLVIDRDEPGTSSRVAAGLVTPITGGRLAKTWRLEDLWPAAVAFYRRAEAETGASLFHPRRIIRLFRDESERALYDRRKDDELRGWVDDPDPPLDPDSFTAPSGGFEMPAAAQLAVADFLDASRRVFVGDGGFAVGAVDPARDVAASADGVRLPRFGATARGVVFCQGIGGIDNPWLRGVRFHPARGDILTLRVRGLAEERVVNRGVWLAPVGDDVFRAGATYDRGTLDPTPTAAGRDEVCARLREFLRSPFEVIDHRSAVRPIITPGRPSLGLHPAEPHVGFFNGLGSKGSIVAPYFATQFAALLSGAGKVDPDVDIAAAMAETAPATGDARPPPLRLTDRAHAAVRAALRPGEVAVDATAGNGHDTRFLAELVGPSGAVYAFDVQADALARTADRLREAGVPNVALLNRDHATLADALPAAHRGRVGAVMFHLGYLPGGDKSCTTTARSSVPALRAALAVLRPGGVVTVVAYTGRPGGADEAAGVRRELAALPSAAYDVEEHAVARGRAAAPVLFVARKRS